MQNIKKKDGFSFDLQTWRGENYMVITEDKTQIALYPNNFNTDFDVNVSEKKKNIQYFFF